MRLKQGRQQEMEAFFRKPSKNTAIFFISGEQNFEVAFLLNCGLADGDVLMQDLGSDPGRRVATPQMEEGDIQEDLQIYL